MVNCSLGDKTFDETMRKVGYVCSLADVSHTVDIRDLIQIIITCDRYEMEKKKLENKK